MSLERMQQLARAYAYEPSRGLEDDGPEPVRNQVRELPLRVDGRRVFVATDGRGECCAVGLMEPGGDKRRMIASMHTAIAGLEEESRLKIV